MQINFRDPVSYGWTPMDLSGWKDGPSYARGVTAVPGRAGLIPDPWTTGERRLITASFMARPATLGDRDALIHTLRDETAGEHWLTFTDSSTTMLRVRRVGAVRILPASAPYWSPDLYADLTWEAVDGIALDRLARAVALPTAGTIIIPVGTAPSALTVILTSAWTSGTSRTLTATAPNGTILGTLTLTAPSSPADSLTANDALEVDMGNRTITKVTGAGVRTNAYAWKTAGDFFTLSGDEGATRSASAWPRLTVSAGDGLALVLRGWAL